MVNKVALVLMFAGVTASCEGKGNGKGNSLDIAYSDLVLALGDPSLSMRKKETARSMLAKADQDVIPILIASLGDKRVFDPEYKSPSSAAATKPRICTVGEMCDAILYRVISGDQVTQYEVSNWETWWQQNKGKRLHEIIQMVRSETGPPR